MRLQSNFAILDVKRGRGRLRQELRKGHIPVIIHGFIDCEHSKDDGTSQEFTIKVDRVEVSNG